jgi:uncharacterized protein (DUF1778 family)
MEKEIRQICTELNNGQIAVVQATEKLLDLFSVSDMLILTPKDAELFFNEVMNPKKANEALKKAMLKFITR